MARQISPERKSLYVVGQIIAAVGLIMFLSTFVTFFMHFGDFGDFNEFEGRMKSNGFRAFGGIALLVAGGVVMNLARQGAAGSGLKLDPDQAREDLEPWARLGGGLQKDALDEMGIDVPKIAGALTGAASGHGRQSLEERLRGLHALYKDGILNEEEYRREKQELLDGR